MKGFCFANLIHVIKCKVMVQYSLSLSLYLSVFPLSQSVFLCLHHISSFSLLVFFSLSLSPSTHLYTINFIINRFKSLIKYKYTVIKTDIICNCIKRSKMYSCLIITTVHTLKCLALESKVKEIRPYNCMLKIFSISFQKCFTFTFIILTFSSVKREITLSLCSHQSYAMQ